MPPESKVHVTKLRRLGRIQLRPIGVGTTDWLWEPDGQAKSPECPVVLLVQVPPVKANPVSNPPTPTRPNETKSVDGKVQVRRPKFKGRVLQAPEAMLRMSLTFSSKLFAALQALRPVTAVTKSPAAVSRAVVIPSISVFRSPIAVFRPPIVVFRPPIVVFKPVTLTFKPETTRRQVSRVAPPLPLPLPLPLLLLLTLTCNA